jgi:hypothetical protein
MIACCHAALGAMARAEVIHPKYIVQRTAHYQHYTDANENIRTLWQFHHDDYSYCAV